MCFPSSFCTMWTFFFHLLPNQIADSNPCPACKKGSACTQRGCSV
jgi:hypothetical protein